MKDKLKMPKKLKIGGRVYTVIFLKEHKENLLGQVNHTTRKIILFRYSHGDKITKQGFEETLLHEIIHSINAVFDIEIKETVINRLSEGLYQVLKDNKITLNGE